MNASNNNENLGIMKSFIIKVYFYNPYIISFLCMMALMPIWISIPEKYNPVYFFALPTGAVFFFAALELLKGRVEITFSDSDMKITYLKNDRFYKRNDTHIEINEIKEGSAN